MSRNLGTTECGDDEARESFSRLPWNRVSVPAPHHVRLLVAVVDGVSPSGYWIDVAERYSVDSWITDDGHNLAPQWWAYLPVPRPIRLAWRWVISEPCARVVASACRETTREIEFCRERANMCAPSLRDPETREASTHDGETVHLCDWSGQPDLHIACGEPWAVPAWETESTSSRTSTEGVYRTDDGRLYTFERAKATCETCKAAPPYVSPEPEQYGGAK